MILSEKFLWGIGDLDFEESVQKFNTNHDPATGRFTSGTGMTSSVAESIISRTKANGGLSVRMVSGHEPRHGYMVATSNEFSKIVDEKAFYERKTGIKILADYAKANRSRLIDGKYYLGLWADGGKVYLDVSERVMERAKAERLGQQRNQKEIWDVANGVGISTGGTGVGTDVQKQSSSGGDSREFVEDDGRADRRLGGEGLRQSRFAIKFEAGLVPVLKYNQNHDGKGKFSSSSGMANVASMWIGGTQDHSFPLFDDMRAAMRVLTTDDNYFPKDDSEGHAKDVFDTTKHLLTELADAKPSEKTLYRGLYMDKIMAGIMAKQIQNLTTEGATFTENLSTWTSNNTLAIAFSRGAYGLGSPHQMGAVGITMRVHGLPSIPITAHYPLNLDDSPLLKTADEHIASGVYKVLKVSKLPKVGNYKYDRFNIDVEWKALPYTKEQLSKKSYTNNGGLKVKKGQSINQMQELGERMALSLIDEDVLKFNPYHDARGRFSTGTGYAQGGYTAEQTYRQNQMKGKGPSAENLIKAISNIGYADSQVLKQQLQQVYGAQVTKINSYGQKVTIRTQIVSAYNGYDSLDIAGVILNQYGDEVGKIERRFKLNENGSLTVEHQYFAIYSRYRDEYVGLGLGKIVLRNSEAYYANIGLHDVTVGTAWDGARHWARAGFDWHPKALNENFNNLVAAGRSLGLHEPAHMLTPELQQVATKYNSLLARMSPDYQNVGSSKNPMWVRQRTLDPYPMSKKDFPIPNDFAMLGYTKGDKNWVGKTLLDELHLVYQKVINAEGMNLKTRPATDRNNDGLLYTDSGRQQPVITHTQGQ